MEPEQNHPFDDCDDDSCLAWYFVALDQGETPELIVEGGDLRITEIHGLDLGPWYNPTYQWRAIPFDDGAPYHGWYRIALETPLERAPEPLVRYSTITRHRPSPPLDE